MLLLLLKLVVPDGDSWSVRVRRTTDDKWVAPEPERIFESTDYLTARTAQSALAYLYGSPQQHPPLLGAIDQSSVPAHLPHFDSIKTWRDLLDKTEAQPPAPGTQQPAAETTIKPIGTSAIGLMTDGQPHAIAWHEPGFVVVDLSGYSAVRAQSRPTAATMGLDREARMHRRGVWPRNRITKWVEWYVVSGTECEYAQGESTTRFRRARLSVTNQTAYAIGRVVAFAGSPRKPASDPTHKWRLREATAEAGYLADVVPDIETIADESVESRRVSIFVHGTVSCGVRYANFLRTMPGARFRFEHDTFRPIDENGDMLIKALRSKTSACAPGGELHLVGHSRGGLVARYAADALIKDDPALRHQITITTLGTPHLGTPLAEAGVLAIRALVRSAALGSPLLGVPSPLAAALPYLIGRRRQRPDGLSVMSPSSNGLKQLNNRHPSFSAPCWSFAGIYDRGEHPTAFGPLVKGAFGRGLFDGAANDLVVAESSARGWGVALYPDTSCGHSDYLLKSCVQDHISRLALQGIRPDRTLTSEEE